MDRERLRRGPMFLLPFVEVVGASTNVLLALLGEWSRSINRESVHPPFPIDGRRALDMCYIAYGSVDLGNLKVDTQLFDMVSDDHGGFGAWLWKLNDRWEYNFL